MTQKKYYVLERMADYGDVSNMVPHFRTLDAASQWAKERSTESLGDWDVCNVQDHGAIEVTYRKGKIV